MNNTIENNNSGITLIALVTTIIVLLILSAISINMVLGDNAILQKTADAKEENRGATVEEEKDLWKMEQLMGKESGASDIRNLEEVLYDLENRNLINSEEKNEIEETGKIIIGSRTIVFLDEPSWRRDDSTSIVNRAGDIRVKIGDYIDYNPEDGVDIENNEIGQYISTEEKNGYRNQVFKLNDCISNWRVLGVEDGKIKIASYKGVRPSEGGEPASSGYSSSADGFVLYGRTGVTNGIEELNNISKLYAKGRYAQGGRSIVVQDVLDMFDFEKSDFLVENNLSYYWYLENLNGELKDRITYVEDDVETIKDANYSTFWWRSNSEWNFLERNQDLAINEREKITDLTTSEIKFGWEDIETRDQRYNLTFIANRYNSDYWIADEASYFLSGTIGNGIQEAWWSHIGMSSIADSDGTEKKISHPVVAVVYLDENVKLTKNGMKDNCDFWEIHL